MFLQCFDYAHRHTYPKDEKHPSPVVRKGGTVTCLGSVVIVPGTVIVNAFDEENSYTFHWSTEMNGDVSVLCVTQMPDTDLDAEAESGTGFALRALLEHMMRKKLPGSVYDVVGRRILDSIPELKE